MAISLKGILFRVWAFGVVMFLLGLVLLIAGGRKYRAISVVLMVFCVLYVGYYLWIYFNPEIAVLEGEFVSAKWHRRVAPHTKAYVFEKENNKRQRLYLDSHTKKQCFRSSCRRTTCTEYTMKHDQVS